MSTSTPVRGSSWGKVLVRAGCFWFALIFADYLAAVFYGSWFWSYAGYFFGTSSTLTLGVLMFLEGAVLVVMGAIWASGAMETVFQGGNLKTNPYYHSQDWKIRREQTQKENIAGKVLLLAGGPILLASFIVVLL